MNRYVFGLLFALSLVACGSGSAVSSATTSGSTSGSGGASSSSSSATGSGGAGGQPMVCKTDADCAKLPPPPSAPCNHWICAGDTLGGRGCTVASAPGMLTCPQGADETCGAGEDGGSYVPCCLANGGPQIKVCASPSGDVVTHECPGLTCDLCVDLDGGAACCSGGLTQCPTSCPTDAAATCAMLFSNQPIPVCGPEMAPNMTCSRANPTVTPSIWCCGS